MFIQKKSGSLWQYYKDEPALDNITTLLIFLLTIKKAFYSNLKKKRQGKQEKITQKMLN